MSNINMDTEMTYQARPVAVEAMRITKDNIPQVAEWCNGDVWKEMFTRQPRGVQFRHGNTIVTATEGEWIVKGADGQTIICSDEQFRNAYELQSEAGENPKTEEG